MKINYNGKLIRLCHLLIAQTVVTLLSLMEPFAVGAEASTSAVVQAEVKAVFGEDCQRLLIGEIYGAKKEIKVAIFSITHEKIVQALVNAAKRGVDVKVKYDAGQRDWETMQAAVKELEKHKIPCAAIKMASEHAGMHHKFAVIDQTRVLTGSFNYSTAGAWNNYENLVLIVSDKIAAQFSKEFEGIADR